MLSSLSSPIFRVRVGLLPCLAGRHCVVEVVDLLMVGYYELTLAYYYLLD